MSTGKNVKPQMKTDEHRFNADTEELFPSGYLCESGQSAVISERFFIF